MSVSVQVIYPAAPGTTFDFDYYATAHLSLLKETWGVYWETVQITKGLAGGPDTPPGYYAIATVVFSNEDKMSAALAVAGPLMKDVPNYTNVEPHMLIGEVHGCPPDSS